MDPLKVVEEFGTAWDEHDLDAALDLVTEDCVFDATGPAPDGASCVGRVQLFSPRRGHPSLTICHRNSKKREIFGVGDHVVQRWRYSWEGGHVRGVDIYLIRDDKVAEKLSYVKG